MTYDDMARAVLAGHATWDCEVRLLGQLPFGAPIPTPRGHIVDDPAIVFTRTGARVRLLRSSP